MEDQAKEEWAKGEQEEIRGKKKQEIGNKVSLKQASHQGAANKEAPGAQQPYCEVPFRYFRPQRDPNGPQHRRHEKEKP
ncbi:hypothetical protein GCM10011405_25050 [Rufibacter glacialis]|nr:hypothetical protein GCM10011405_25050 [Rufibacter glacialis]